MARVLECQSEVRGYICTRAEWHF